MIKGLLALFTSGLIFSPMVLLGVVSGAWTIVNLSPDDIRNLFFDIRFYVVVAILAVLFTILFAKVYKTGGTSIDWTATVAKMFWNFVKYFIAFVLSMSFVTMISIF